MQLVSEHLMTHLWKPVTVEGGMLALFSLLWKYRHCWTFFIQDEVFSDYVRSLEMCRPRILKFCIISTYVLYLWQIRSFWECTGNTICSREMLTSVKWWAHFSNRWLGILSGLPAWWWFTLRRVILKSLVDTDSTWSLDGSVVLTSLLELVASNRA